MATNNIKTKAALNLPFTAILFFVLMMIVSVTAQENKESAFVTDFFKAYDYSIDHVAQLAGAIPADKYDWRPAEGVRSIREVVLHVAGGNYLFSSLLGSPPPEGVDARGLEKMEVSKEEAIAKLKESVAHAKKAVGMVGEDALNQEVEFFGNKVTKRHLLFIAGGHVSEHLGQLIAYARTNGVAPPWSE
ncbi:hypothetical protein A2V82_11765 [candidate division KSB1 bacterium RBG_16_48_16]|nr:MAG: hypothetical protein A2V82_11765 [candidate division KSB1 bacterium RBG_16_48_16]